MARTNKTTKASKSTKTYKPANKSSKPTKLSFLQQKVNTKLVVFVLIFAALGTYFLIRSRANQGVGFKLAQVAANLTTAQQGPRVVRETSGNKRNADVVLVSAANGQSNHVYVTYNATSAGIYKICGFGRRNDGGTAKLYAANAPYPYTTITRPESYIVADYPVTTGTDYKNVCTSLELKRAGTIYISNVVTSGTWNFSINTLDRTGDVPQPPDDPKGKGTYPTSREQTGLGRLGINADSLPVYNGPTTIDKDGTTIDSLRINKPIVINAKNVTLRKVDLDASGSYAVLQVNDSASGLTVEDSNIHGYGTERLVRHWGPNGTYKHVAIWGGEGGLGVGNSITIEDSFIRPDHSTNNGQHTTAIGTNGGTDNVRIVRSYLENASPGKQQSSALSAYPETQWGPNSDWLIENSYLSASDAYYAIYAGHTPEDGEKPNQRLVFRNNTIQKGRSDYVASWSGARINGPSGNEYGNVWDNNKDPNGNVIRL